MDRPSLFKKGLHIEYATVGWSIGEAIISIVAGIIADSIALIGYGLVRVVETISGGVHLWLLRRMPDRDKRTEQSGTERRTFFVVGAGFVLLSLYIINESGFMIYYKEKPEISLAGLILSILSMIFASSLVFTKVRLSRALESRNLGADLRSTAVRAYLTLMLFAGLGCNAWFGWWWADPVAALLMVPLIVREGWDAIETSKGNSPTQIVKTDS